MEFPEKRDNWDSILVQNGPALACFLTGGDGILLFGVQLLHLSSPPQLEPASVSFAGLPQLLQQQRLLIVPERSQTLRPPAAASNPAAALQAADDIAQDVGVGGVLVEGVAVQGLLDQLLGAGARRSQDALVVGAGAYLVAKNLEDAGRRALCGELGRVVLRSLWGFGGGASVPPRVGAGFHGHTVPVAQRAVQDLAERSKKTQQTLPTHLFT